MIEFPWGETTAKTFVGLEGATGFNAAWERMRDDADPMHVERPAQWVTVVLGSRCPRTLDRELAEFLDAAPQSVSSAVRVDDLPDGRPAAEVVDHFLAALIRAHRGDSWASSSTTKPRAPTPLLRSADAQALFHSVLATALLAELYYVLCAICGDPLVGPSGSRVSLAQAGARQSELSAVWVGPVRDALSRARVFKDGRAAEIAARLCDLTRPFEYSGEDVWLLGEQCWIDVLRISGTATLRAGDHRALAALQPRDDTDSETHVGRLERTTKHIRDLVEPGQHAAWHQLEAVAGNRAGAVKRDSVLWACADLVANQRRQRSQQRALECPPVPAVYITGFDLEFEMTLLLSSIPFVMALPVLVITEQDAPDDPRSRAALCWFGAVVPAGTKPSLEAIRTRPHEDWVLLNNRKDYGWEEQFKELPVVVHLSGSPLINLPPKTGAFARTVRDHIDLVKGRSLRGFKHAVVLDEQLAIQQLVTDSFLYPSTTGETKYSRVEGLPAAITVTDSFTFRRFWTLVGVQLDDGLTRRRVIGGVVNVRPAEHPRLMEAGHPFGAAFGASDADVPVLRQSGLHVVMNVSPPTLAAWLRDQRSKTGTKGRRS